MGAVITTVIFDLDGLLTDTEPLHCQAWRETLAGVGVELSEAEFCDHWIRAGLEIRQFVERRGLAHDPEALRAAKLTRFTTMLETSLRPMPGAIALIEALHGRQRLALATSSFRITVELILERLRVAPYFEAIATHESVTRLKPYPDVFLHVAERLDVAPADCIVLEDAEKGVLAAHAAGMKIIAVPTPHTRDNDFSRATRVVSSLEQVTLELIESLA
jgi:HAD superfamily hydrolase (TIGR01509 family)